MTRLERVETHVVRKNGAAEEKHLLADEDLQLFLEKGIVGVESRRESRVWRRWLRMKIYQGKNRIGRAIWAKK